MILLFEVGYMVCPLGMLLPPSGHFEIMQFQKTETQRIEHYRCYKCSFKVHIIIYLLQLFTWPHEAPLTELIYDETIHVIRFPATSSDIFFSNIMGAKPKWLVNTEYVVDYELEWISLTWNFCQTDVTCEVKTVLFTRHFIHKMSLGHDSCVAQELHITDAQSSCRMYWIYLYGYVYKW